MNLYYCQARRFTSDFLMLNVGLIGYGIAGKYFHQPVIDDLSEYQLSKIVVRAIRPEENDCGDVLVTTNISDILSDDAIDLVVVATPHASHYKHAKAALEAGKHVLVEKPFTMDTREAEELLQLAKEKSRIITVYHNRRQDSDFLTVKRCIKEGLLGRIFSFESNYSRYRTHVGGKWKETCQTSGGCLYDIAPHLIDQALVLFGTPNTIFIDKGIHREKAIVEDFFSIHMNCQKTRILLRHAATCYDVGFRYIVHGEKGSLFVMGQDEQDELLRKNISHQSDSWRPHKNITATIKYTDGCVEAVGIEKGCYHNFYKSLYDAITKSSKPPVSANEIIAVSRIIETKGLELC